jgi:hypothetical protein
MKIDILIVRRDLGTHNDGATVLKNEEDAAVDVALEAGHGGERGRRASTNPNKPKQRRDSSTCPKIDAFTFA